MVWERNLAGSRRHWIDSLAQSTLAASLLCVLPIRPRDNDEFPLTLNDGEWRRRLTADEYRILRQGATEAPGSSTLLREHRAGTYVCAGCQQIVFDADTKYNDGSGWPTFRRAVEDGVETRSRNHFGFRDNAAAVHCSRCGGHLGDVFKDGPPRSGKRWRINGTALDFIPR